MADLVIRNGTIVDGTGGVPYVGDVAIKDGLILAAGPNLSVKGAREVRVASEADVYNLLEVGFEARLQGASTKNPVSSRSHAILAYECTGDRGGRARRRLRPAHPLRHRHLPAHRRRPRRRPQPQAAGADGRGPRQGRWPLP